jgi:hypothetical protein
MTYPPPRSPEKACYFTLNRRAEIALPGALNRSAGQTEFRWRRGVRGIWGGVDVRARIYPGR